MSNERFFEQAMEEVSTRKVVPAVWAKALAEADGDKVKTVARYVRYRVEQLESEAAECRNPPPTPSLAGQTTARPETHAAASAWKRFIARTIDLMWEALVLGALVSYFASFNLEFNGWLQGTDALVLGILMTPLVLAFDALVAGVCFITPGKALLRLRVVDEKMGRLAGAGNFQRNMRLWASGLAFGVPAINLFAMAFQGDRVRKTGRATYDVAMRTRVVEKPLGVVQGLLTLLVFVMLISMHVILPLSDVGASSHATPSDEWLTSVRKLQGMIRDGTMDTVRGRHIQEHQVSGGFWPIDAVLAIENNSTWWTEGGSVFLVVRNNADYNLKTMRIEYEDKGCSESSDRQSFYVTLERVVSPGETVTATFDMLVSQYVAEGVGNCLIVAGVWD